MNKLTEIRERYRQSLYDLQTFKDVCLLLDIVEIQQFALEQVKEEHKSGVSNEYMFCDLALGRVKIMLGE